MTAPLVALLHQGNLDALGAVVLVVGFVPGLVLGYLLGWFDRREKTLDEHADDALALFEPWPDALINEALAWEPTDEQMAAFEADLLRGDVS